MAKAHNERRSALASGELPSYARPTRASITRMTANGVAGAPQQKCQHKACSCSVSQNISSKPSPPKTPQVTTSTMLGKHPHDRASRCMRKGRGRSYRSGQIGAQAVKGPSQVLQYRIKQLARGIKDKHTGKSNDEIEIPVPVKSEQVKINVTEDDLEQETFQVGVDRMDQNKQSIVNVNSSRMFRTEGRSKSTKDSTVIWESEESEELEHKTDSVKVHEQHEKLKDTKVARTNAAYRETTTPPDSTPPRRKARRSAVFDPPTIEVGSIEPQKLLEKRSKRTEPLINLKILPLSESPARKRPTSPVINKEQIGSPLRDHLTDLSPTSPTITEEAEPLEVEYPPDLPARYRSQPAPPVIKETTVPNLPTQHRPNPVPPVIKEIESPLDIEYPPNLPARYRSQPAPPVIRETAPPLDIEYPPDLPSRYRNRKPSKPDIETIHLDAPSDLPPRYKSRTPSLVPNGGPLLGWTPPPVAGMGQARGNSVINISSSYRARRSSVFGMGMMTSYEVDSMGATGLASSPAQFRRPSVVELFRRSKQSRHRRLSVYLQTFDDKKERAIERLKRISKTVKIIAGICLSMKKYVKTGEPQQWSLIEMHLNLRADMEKKLAFDPIMFSKLRVTRGSEKLRSILSEKASERTSEDVDVVLALMRKNKTFAEYDRDTQIALAKVMEYLRYEPRRIILKEGHLASGFYIILSGTCLVNQKEIDPRNSQTFVRTIDEIHSGDSFGSNELMNNCMRTVSIVCKDECEVLLVNKEDFDTIIREPLEQERRNLIEFCNTQNVFEKLPTNFDFSGNHHAISAKKYKPGEVITSDINESDFIYVVRSGKCRVISEVKEIKGRQAVTQATTNTLNNEEWKKDALIKRSMTVIESMGNKRKWASEPKGKLSQVGRQKTFFSLTGIKEGKPKRRHSPPYFHRAFNKPVTLPELKTTSRQLNMIKSVDFTEVNEKDDPPAIPKTLFDDQDLLQTKPYTKEQPDRSGMFTTWRRVSMAASVLSEKERRRNPLLYLKPSRLRSTYAEVAVLKEGNVFGIETLVTVGQAETRLSLLSEGADCIVISKKFFATQATIKAIQRSTKSAIEYPSAEYTLNQIRQARAWTSYKDSLVKDVCNRKRSKGNELCR